MGITASPLAQADLTTVSETVIYTVPAATAATLSCILVHNRTASTVTCKLYHRLAADGSTGNKNEAWNLTIPANDTFVANVGKTLATGDSFRATAGTANAITVQLDGVLVT